MQCVTAFSPAGRRIHLSQSILRHCRQGFASISRIFPSDVPSNDETERVVSQAASRQKFADLGCGLDQRRASVGPVLIGTSLSKIFRNKVLLCIKQHHPAGA